MMNENCKYSEQITKFGGLAVRIVLGLIFVIAGFGKLMDGAQMFTGMLDGMGFPLAVVFAWLVTVIELVGGILLILGFWDKIVASLLAIIMLVALFMVHLGSWNEAKYPLLLSVLLIKYIGSNKCGGLLTMCKMKKH